MEISGNTLVFAILGIAFAAVGVHLFLWSRKRSRQIRRFAVDNHLAYRAKDTIGIQQLVNEAVEIEEYHMGRRFDRVRDVVEFGHGTIFRAVEALDLVPWGEPQNTHHVRTAITFPTAAEMSGIFLIDTDGSVHQRYPVDADDNDRLHVVLADAGVPRPPWPLSLTIMQGRVVACLEPTVTGALDDEHLRYLVELGRCLAST